VFGSKTPRVPLGVVVSPSAMLASELGGLFVALREQVSGGEVAVTESEKLESDRVREG